MVRRFVMLFLLGACFLQYCDPSTAPLALDLSTHSGTDLIQRTLFFVLLIHALRIISSADSKREGYEVWLWARPVIALVVQILAIYLVFRFAFHLEAWALEIIG